MNTARRLIERDYPAEWQSIYQVYTDAMDVIAKEQKQGYNPKSEHQSAKGIWERVETRYTNPILILDAIVDVISKCCHDYVKAFENKAIELDHDQHCFPFCTGEMPTLKKLHTFWGECWGITIKTYRKGEDKRADAEGREKFAKEAEAAREADKARETEQKPSGEPGIREREMIDQWAAKNQDEFAELDKQARAHVRFIFPKKINYPGKGVQQFDADAKINARRGWAYALYLVKLEEAIFQGKPIKSPVEIKAHGDSLRGYDTSGPRRRLARQSMVQAAAGVETNQTDKTEAEKVAV